MRGANSVWLNGRDFATDLTRALGVPVRLVNDADCLILSESTDGAAAGAKGALRRHLGHGLRRRGGGGRQAAGGRQRRGGEWGHTPLPWPTDQDKAPPCWCGRTGCLETFVSGTALAADHARATGRKMKAEEVVAAARTGDRWAAEALDRYIERLGRALAVMIDLIDPSVIVLGGGMSNVDELYEPCPARSRRTCSATTGAPGSPRRRMGIPRACAAPRGCGRWSR